MLNLTRIRSAHWAPFFLVFLLGHLAVAQQLPNKEQCRNQLRSAEQKFKGAEWDKVVTLGRRLADDAGCVLDVRIRAYDLLGQTFLKMSIHEASFNDSARTAVQSLLALQCDFQPESSSDIAYQELLRYERARVCRNEWEWIAVGGWTLLGALLFWIISGADDEPPSASYPP